ncbi:hypothetical protein EW145_g5561 [Phellinidium pouzarii]|uniref:HMG box domain-containing protein n=1 Tax=Phellinidium pouzarii TaxID=167371 RepID=A0A4S4KZT0_9AGAM|nr:hypothetical protein EW145_g5561 [Phellinidium pouzarii]
MPRVASEKTTKTARKAAATASGDGKRIFSPKAKRQPSAYNMFVGIHLKEWKRDHPGIPIKEGMVAVAELWRDAAENPKRGQAPAKKEAKVPKAKVDKENAKKPKAKPKKEINVEEEGGDAGDE